MSRTYRRKHYEITKNRSGYYQGSKLNGYYTYWDFYTQPINGHCGTPIYYAASGKEYFKEYYRIHGESKHRNAWGPGKDYKRPSVKRWRTLIKSELRKELMSDHEGFYPRKEQTHWDYSYW